MCVCVCGGGGGNSWWSGLDECGEVEREGCSQPHRHTRAQRQTARALVCVQTIDEQRSKMSQKYNTCIRLAVVVVGAGPVGLRTAIGMALLDAQVGTGQSDGAGGCCVFLLLLLLLLQTWADRLDADRRTNTQADRYTYTHTSLSLSHTHHRSIQPACASFFFLVFGVPGDGG